MANLLYDTIYQIRKPAPGPVVGQVANANLYVKELRRALVLAPDSGPGIIAAIKNNETLASGEVVDLLRAQQHGSASTGGIWQ